MKGERKRVGGWTIKTEKLCVYKQQQKKTNKRKQTNKQTKKTTELNTEIPKLAVSSFFISLRFLLVHEQK